MDITHDNVCSSMLSCFYSHLLSTGRPISSFQLILSRTCLVNEFLLICLLNEIRSLVIKYNLCFSKETKIVC